MIDLERRLQHAARELREIEIEPPPLEHLDGRRPARSVVGRVPALVMPVLFVLGGLAVVAGGVSRQADEVPVTAEPATTMVPEAGADGGGADSAAPMLTAHQEIALISSLGPATVGSGDPGSSPEADDVRTLAQRYR